MALAVATTLLSLVALATLAGCVWLWGIAFLWARSGRPLVPWRPRRAVPWAFIDLLLLAGVWVLATLAMSVVFRQLGWNPGDAEIEELTLVQRATVIAANVVVSIAILAMGLPIVALRSGGTATNFGLSLDSFWSDVRLGVAGFVMLAPPVYALQGLLVTVWKPSKHPLMEMFKDTPEAWFFGLLFVSAAVIAPLFEELIFRVVLQGFLEKAFSFAVPLPELVAGSLAREPQLSGRMADDFEADYADSANPYAPPRVLEDAGPAPMMHEEQAELRRAAAWLPIAISSGVFALLHYSHGPDWIPLLVLAAGMGYLYQRTHRLLPSLTVHALLNAVSLCALWVQVNGEK